MPVAGDVRILSHFWLGRDPWLEGAGFSDSVPWKARNHADGRVNEDDWWEGNGTVRSATRPPSFDVDCGRVGVHTVTSEGQARVNYRFGAGTDFVDQSGSVWDYNVYLDLPPGEWVRIEQNIPGCVQLLGMSCTKRAGRMERPPRG